MGLREGDGGADVKGAAVQCQGSALKEGKTGGYVLGLSNISLLREGSLEQQSRPDLGIGQKCRLLGYGRVP